MQQASDAMREALKGDSAASAAVSDMDVDAAVEMVCGCQHTSEGITSTTWPEIFTQPVTTALQIPPAVNIELRQQLEDMGFNANK